MNIFLGRYTLLATVLLLSACSKGGGSSSSTTVPDNTSTVLGLPVITTDGAACAPTGSTVTLSGSISYERAPVSAALGNGLDYNNIQTLPVRGAEIQLLGAADCVMASSTTSATGTYSLVGSESTEVKVRVKVRTSSTVGATWDFEVRDNTNGNGLYVMDGSSVDSGASDSTRNLTAISGWTGTSYGAARVSAPFAILDTIYTALQTVVSVDGAVNMDDADIFWSVKNSTASGVIANGEIGTSFYSGDQIYILGTANSDTDEFDQHVLVHEWGHYFEDNLSRSDSVGGRHSPNESLDMRVALGEGFGNAFSGMVLSDSVYRDSGGASQANDLLSFNLETNAFVNVGWFREASVQTILYDIFDTTSDASDTVSLGFAAIYNAMISMDYIAQSSFTSIFSLVDKIQDDNPGSVSAINTLLVSQGINAIVDQYGTNETNNGGSANNLPVYKLLADDGVPVNVCSSNANGEPNKLGAIGYLRLNVASSGVHNIVATRVSGLASSDPDVRVYLNGTRTLSGVSVVANSETINGNLNMDEYVVEVREFTNTDGNNGTGGNVCFNVTVS